MSEVDALERDVEAARARLVSRVAQLKGPPLAGVKDELVAEATEYKDEMIESAKQKVTGTIDEIVADLKRRATDNPIAVVAIGAGIAWKLWQKPPVTTLLVGAGVAALFGAGRRIPQIEVDPYNPDRPSGYVPGGVGGYGYERTRDVVEQKVIGGVTVAAETARQKASELRDRVTEVTHRARNSAAEIKDNVVRSASELTDRTLRSVDDIRTSAVRSGTRALDTVSDTAADARMRIEPYREYTADALRDNGVYLSLAALAVGAAAGIGLMQMNKAPPVDEDYLEGEDIRVE